MQDTKHKALQGVSAGLNMSVVESGEPEFNILTNSGKSFQRLVKVFEKVLSGKNPYYAVFSHPDLIGVEPLTDSFLDINKPLVMTKSLDNTGLLMRVVATIFRDATCYSKKKPMIDFCFYDNSHDIYRIEVDCDDLMRSLVVRGGAMMAITHTMHDISELANLYGIDPNESLSSVKEKIAEHLEDDSSVSYYELDIDYLECLIERQAIS